VGCTSRSPVRAPDSVVLLKSLSLRGHLVTAVGNHVNHGTAARGQVAAFCVVLCKRWRSIAVEARARQGSGERHPRRRRATRVTGLLPRTPVTFSRSRTIWTTRQKPCCCSSCVAPACAAWRDAGDCAPLAVAQRPCRPRSRSHARRFAIRRALAPAVDRRREQPGADLPAQFIARA